jgi:hypothetical protein
MTNPTPQPCGTCGSAYQNAYYSAPNCSDPYHVQAPAEAPATNSVDDLIAHLEAGGTAEVVFNPPLTQAQPKTDEAKQLLRIVVDLAPGEAVEAIHRLITEARVSELEATKHLIEARIVIEGDDGDYKTIIEDIEARLTSLKREDSDNEVGI